MTMPDPAAVQAAEGDGPWWVRDHLSTLVLGHEPELLNDLAAQRLAPLDQLRPNQRARLAETLPTDDDADAARLARREREGRLRGRGRRRVDRPRLCGCGGAKRGGGDDAGGETTLVREPFQGAADTGAIDRARADAGDDLAKIEHIQGAGVGVDHPADPAKETTE